MRLSNHLVSFYGLDTSLKQNPRQSTFTRVFWLRDALARLLLDSGLDGFQYQLIWDLSVIVFTVLTVEFSIALNNIVKVNSMRSAGQLIPFVAGLGGFLTVGSQLYAEYREKRRKHIANHSAEVQVCRCQTNTQGS